MHSLKLEFSGTLRSGDSHKEITIYPKPNRLDLERDRCRHEDIRDLPQVRHSRRHLLQLEAKYDGMAASDLSRLKKMEVELPWLKCKLEIFTLSSSNE